VAADGGNGHERQQHRDQECNPHPASVCVKRTVRPNAVAIHRAAKTLAAPIDSAGGTNWLLRCLLGSPILPAAGVFEQVGIRRVSQFETSACRLLLLLAE
jgi:hypothetical protein